VKKGDRVRLVGTLRRSRLQEGLEGTVKRILRSPTAYGVLVKFDNGTETIVVQNDLEVLPTRPVE
jgi:hypothetical protein